MDNITHTFVGLGVGVVVNDQTPLLAGLVTTVLLYTRCSATRKLSVHRVLDPVGAGQLTDAVIKR